MLPIAFTDRMKDMLGDTYEEFLSSYQKEKYQALRINPLKVDKEVFLENNPFKLTLVSWEENGFYYDREDIPGKHPYHEAGVYYIQEPSAMAPVPFLEVQPGERILDLCAAPGGKSTQIGAALAGKGREYRIDCHSTGRYMPRSRRLSSVKAPVAGSVRA